MGANIGWLFYRDYFKGIDYTKLSDKKDTTNKNYLEKRVDAIVGQKPKIVEENILGNVHFKASTTYPGLLLGSGNAHELPSVEGQLSLGFSFDYATGLPVIAGSSIKGVLRSAFRHKEYIQELLGDEQIDVEALEKEIFDNGDIFFDAVVQSYATQLLSDDFLTPHDDEGIKNPTPIRFLKVAPAVTFVFDFYLQDTLISKDKKRKLFEAILEDIGVGAKTNVGYGKFENFAPFKTEAERAAYEKALEEEKKRLAKEQEEEQQRKKEEKLKKAKEGIDTLLECKTLPEAFKLLKDSFGAKPKPTPEQKAIIQEFFNKQKNLSKGDKKTFKKYGVS